MTPQKSEGERMREIGASLGWTDIHGGPEDGGAYWRGTPPGSNRVVACPDWIHPEMTSSETLAAIFNGSMLKWRQLPNLGETVMVCVYYPSEEAFRSTITLKKGGHAWTEEGEEIRLEAHRMRSAFVAAFPDGKIGFDIEPTNQPSAMGGECCFCESSRNPLMEVSEAFAYAEAWKMAAGTANIYACRVCFSLERACHGEWKPLPIHDTKEGKP